MENVFSTINEISEYLKLKPCTLYVMVAEKRIPHFKIGRLVRFKKSEIDAWMEGQRKECTDPQKEAKRVLRTVPRPEIDVGRIVKKSIEGEKREGYTASCGKTRPSQRPQKGGF